MAIGLIIPDRDTSLLKKTLKKELSDIPIFEYPNISEPQEIELLVLWKHPKNMLSQFPNLKLISSLGAGIDHILKDESLPKNIPVTRIVDAELTISMRKYLLMCVLNFHKDILGIMDFNSKRNWIENRPIEKQLKIGIMGLGTLGKDIAIHLQNIGFQVFGYSFSEKNILGLKCYSKAKNEINDFLSSINVLINLLPLTKETRGILNEHLFEKLPDNSYLVNVGRGAHLIDSDLIKAIENGKIKSAFLDVFNQEPLPQDHPYWSTPEIVLTPHIASITNQKNAALQIAENYRNILKNAPLKNQIDLKKGY